MDLERSTDWERIPRLFYLVSSILGRLVVQLDFTQHPNDVLESEHDALFSSPSLSILQNSRIQRYYEVKIVPLIIGSKVNCINDYAGRKCREEIDKPFLG